MQHGEDRQSALIAQAPDRAQQGDLVGQVQVQGRLVEQQQLRLLGKRHRHQQPLALAAGELLHRAIGQLGGIGVVEGALNRGLVLGRRAEEAPGVRRATHRHQLGDPKAARQLQLLRQHCHPSGKRLAAPGRHRKAVEANLTGGGYQRAGEAAQQGRLAAAVGAEQRNQLAMGQRQVHPMQHLTPPAARKCVPGLQADRRRQLPGCAASRCHEIAAIVCERRSSQMKNGAPSRAVTIPTGIPPASRAPRSARVSSAAPYRTLAGSSSR